LTLYFFATLELLEKIFCFGIPPFFYIFLGSSKKLKQIECICYFFIFFSINYNSLSFSVYS